MSEIWIARTSQAGKYDHFELHFGGNIYVLPLDTAEKIGREILWLLGIDVAQKEPLPFEPLPDPPEPSVAIRGQREAK